MWGQKTNQGQSFIGQAPSVGKISKYWFLIRKLSWLGPLIIRLLPPILIIILAFVGYSILMDARDIPSKKSPKLSVRQVDVLPVQKSEALTLITRSGYIEAGSILPLQMKVEGSVQLVHQRFRTGEWVTKGEPLVELDPYLLTLEFDRIKARQDSLQSQIKILNIEIKSSQKLVATAQQKVNLRTKDVIRSKKLAGRGASSASKLEESQRSLIVAQQDLLRAQQTSESKKITLDILQADMRQIEIDMRQAQYDLDNSVLRAPLSGFLDSTNVSVGQQIRRSDVLANMIDPTQFQIPIPLSQKDLSLLMAGTKSVVGDFWKEWRLAAQIQVGLQQIDLPVTRLRLDSQAPDRAGGVQFRGFLGRKETILRSQLLLRPRMYATVTIKGPKLRDVLRVPRQIVQVKNRDQYFGNATILSVIPDGKTAFLKEEQVWIRGGVDEDLLIETDLSEGSYLLKTRIDGLQPNLRVKIAPDSLITTSSSERK